MPWVIAKKNGRKWVPGWVLTKTEVERLDDDPNNTYMVINTGTHQQVKIGKGRGRKAAGGISYERGAGERLKKYKGLKVAPGATINVYYDPKYNDEYVVKVRVGGKLVGEYFFDTKTDALHKADLEFGRVHRQLMGMGERGAGESEGDILYEVGDYWVKARYFHPSRGKDRREGFEVYKAGATHSTRVASIGYPGSEGLERAKREADKRHQADQKRGASERSPAANEDNVRELVLYIDNDSDLYHGITAATMKQLAKKMLKGNYNSSLAVKAWEHVANAGAKKYTKEFDGDTRTSYGEFSVADRRAVAKELSEAFEGMVKNNELDVEKLAKGK